MVFFLVLQIMGRKANPDASYLEIEKQFYKRKGKLVEIKEVPFDGSKEVQSSSSLDGLNLVRPVPKEGFTFEADDKPMDMKKPIKKVGKAVGSPKGSVPNVILRKPSRFNEDNVGGKSSRLRIKPNLSLKMGNGQVKDKFSDMTLLRKPEPVSVNQSIEKKQEPYGNVDAKVVEDAGSMMRREEAIDKVSDFTLLKKPESMSVNTDLENNSEQFGNDMTLLRKLEPVNVDKFIEKKQEPYGNVDAKVDDIESKMRREEANDKVSDFTLLKKPEPMSVNTDLENNSDQFGGAEAEVRDDIEENALPGLSEFIATANTITNNFEKIENGLFSNESEQDNDFVVGIALYCILEFNLLKLSTLSFCLAF